MTTLPFGRSNIRPAYTIEGDGEGGSGSGGGSGDGGSGGGSGEAGQQQGGDGEGVAKEFKAIGSQEDLDRIVQSRLARERTKFADYDDLKTKASEYDKQQEANKSELQKANDRAAKAEAAQAETSLTAMRLEVAIDKGLTPVQAKRLVGKTKEELEADADELIASFTPANGEGSGKTTPAGRARERLRGGGDPTEEVEETDPRKLAAKVDRL